MQTENDSEQQKEEPTLKEKTAKSLLWIGASNFLQQIIGMVLAVWMITKHIDTLWRSIILKITLTGISYLSILWLCNSIILKEAAEMIKDRMKNYRRI
jgi:hypothetical protein